MNEPRVDVSDEAALPGQETDTLLEPHEDETDNDSHERRSQLLKILPALLLWFVDASILRSSTFRLLMHT
jgi:hypothetical protein